MCGILLRSSDNEIDLPKFVAAMRSQNHRGPDDQRIIWRSSDGSVHERDVRQKSAVFDRGVRTVIGHSRLSILDLTSASSQPMLSDRNEYALAFNGCIYNYREIRSELEQVGVRCQSTGDTEVLFKALMCWGSDAIKKLNGMWAFVFYDISNDLIHMSRDEYGKKPLFYYKSKSDFIAASEFKSIFSSLSCSGRSIDPDYVAAYLFRDHLPVLDRGRTFYRDISTVEPGEWLTFSVREKTLETQTKTSLLSFAQHTTCNAVDLAADIKSAVDVRLRADVPTAVLVSGGIDSTVVAAYASRSQERCRDDISFYTVKTAASQDFPYAKTVAKALDVPLNIIDVSFRGREEITNFREMVKQYETPIKVGGVTNSAFYAFRRMANDGVRVVLDGTGGDEIFSGYYKHYRTSHFLSLLYSGKFVNALTAYRAAGGESISLRSQCAQTLKSAAMNTNVWVRSIVRELYVNRLLEQEFSFHAVEANRSIASGYCQVQNDRFGSAGMKGLRSIQLRDIEKGILPVWLWAGDQNSMQSSVELRSPLLDRRLLKYLNLSLTDKVRDSLWKYALRRSIPDVIPEEVTLRKQKVGFEWDRTSFVESFGGEIIDTLRMSTLVSSIIDIDGLIRKWNCPGKMYLFDRYVLRCYSLALLDEIYGCKV
jgi:asparagine synthase (glutamine-hydrolysing)